MALADQVVALIESHEVLALMAGAVIEAVIVPVPSPIIPMAGGALVLDSGIGVGQLLFDNLVFVSLPVSVASITASFLVFGIFWKYGRSATEKFGWMVDVDWDEVEELSSRVEERHGPAVLFSFAFPLFPLSLVSASAGFVRMDWREYALWGFGGMVIRNYILGLAGWYAGAGFRRVASVLDTASSLVLAGFMLVLAYFVGRRLSSKILSLS